ncbi:MAG: hypothetical protein FWD29_07045 [Micrococcales bacterium]|nr:hypothetical protein [Micrococcales bacterium]
MSTPDGLDAGLVEYEHDSDGRVIETRNAWWGRRQFSYDEAGHLVESVNGNGGVSRYVYDQFGRVVEITNPVGGVTQRQFDERNNCIAVTDPLGRTTRAEYDLAGRQSWQEDPDGHRTQWDYDQAGRLDQVSVDGQVMSKAERDDANLRGEMTDTSGPEPVIYGRAWDRSGRLLAETRGQVGLRWVYDRKGRLSKLATPDGREITYTYDKAGRLTAVSHPVFGRARFDYDTAGQLARSEAGPMSQTWHWFAGEVVGLEIEASGTNHSVEVTRDDWGLVDQVSCDGVATAYGYDPAGQLISATTRGETSTWTYDLAGRLVKETGPAGQYDYRHDVAGQLLESTGPGGTARHCYDGSGRRIRSDLPGGVTRDFAWSPNGFLAAVTDTVGGEVSRTTLLTDSRGQLVAINDQAVWWDNGGRLAPSLLRAGATPVFSLVGLIGMGDSWISPGWHTSQSDHVADPWVARPVTVDGELPTGVGLAAGGRLTFAGGPGVAGLELVGRRVVDPASRGFLSTDANDPVVGAGWAGNPYAYGGNNPVGWFGPAGLRPLTDADILRLAQAS